MKFYTSLNENYLIKFAIEDREKKKDNDNLFNVPMDSCYMILKKRANICNFIWKKNLTGSSSFHFTWLKSFN